MKKLVIGLGLLSLTTSSAFALKINTKSMDKICKLQAKETVGVRALEPADEVKFFDIDLYKNIGGPLAVSAEASMVANCKTKKTKLQYRAFKVNYSMVNKTCKFPVNWTDFGKYRKYTDCVDKYIDSHSEALEIYKRDLKKSEYRLDEDGNLVLNIKNVKIAVNYNNYMKDFSPEVQVRGLDNFLGEVKLLHTIVKKDNFDYESVEDESSNEYYGSDSEAFLTVDPKNFFTTVVADLKKQFKEAAGGDVGQELNRFEDLTVAGFFEMSQISLENDSQIQPALFTKVMMHPLKDEDEMYNLYIAPYQVDLSEIFEFIAK